MEPKLAKGACLRRSLSPLILLLRVSLARPPLSCPLEHFACDLTCHSIGRDYWRANGRRVRPRDVSFLLRLT
jgi:hypothetical protein